METAASHRLDFYAYEQMGQTVYYDQETFDEATLKPIVDKAPLTPGTKFITGCSAGYVRGIMQPDGYALSENGGIMMSLTYDESLQLPQFAGWRVTAFGDVRALAKVDFV